MAQNRKSNGSGSIYFDVKREKWCAEIQWSDKGGEKHRKKFSGQKKSVVKNKLEEFRRRLLIANGNFTDEDVTFQEFAEYWLTSVLKNKLKPTSYNRKATTLEHQVYPHIGGIPINRISHFDIQDMVNTLNQQGLSYSTIKKAYEAVNGCLKEYRIKTESSFNPCEGIVLPVTKKHNISNIVYFNDDERLRIKNEATRLYNTGKPVYRLGHAVVILMYTGLRVGELLALTWEDIDLVNKTITVNKNVVVAKIKDQGGTHYKLINQDSTKTKSGTRIVPMTETAKSSFEAIAKFNGEKKYIFSSSNNTQITPRNLNRMFHNILSRTGISVGDANCGVHSLRHTFASMLFKNGCKVKVVSEILGHADTKITENIYIHLIQQQKVSAIENIDKYSD